MFILAAICLKTVVFKGNKIIFFPRDFFLFFSTVIFLTFFFLNIIEILSPVGGGVARSGSILIPEVTVGSAIEVVHGDDVVPRLEEQGDSVGGRQPA